MKISNRLKLIASFVDDNSNVFDVGCDHALLDIFLVKNKKNINAIASDINSKPLEIAKRNIAFYNVSDLVEVRVGDGIKNINDKCDTIIISGLGGDTIINILQRDLDKLKNINTMIISPHTSVYEVRKYITSIGYRIEDELLTIDQNKIYTIIKFIKGHSNYTDEELFFGPIILKRRNNIFNDYCQKMLKKNKYILNKIPKDNVAYEKIMKEIERLEQILKV